VRKVELFKKGVDGVGSFLVRFEMVKVDTSDIMQFIECLNEGFFRFRLPFFDRNKSADIFFSKSFRDPEELGRIGDDLCVLGLCCFDLSVDDSDGGVGDDRGVLVIDED